MTTAVLTPPILAAPRLVPPTVAPAAHALSVPQFLRKFISNPLSALPAAVYDEPMVARQMGKRTTIWVSDPALVEKVLLQSVEQFAKTPLERRVFEGTLGDGILTSQGASWKWQRRTAAPLFRPADLAALVPAMSREAQVQLDRWRRAAPGTTHPVHTDMSEMTFRVISATMFAGSADADVRAFHEAGDKSLKWVTWEIAAGIFGVPKWVWHPGKWPRAQAAKQLRGVVNSLLDRRLAAGIEGDKDLLARLALAKDSETGQPMDREQLIDNLLTFLGAGHETTAKALTWTLYLLARAPEWQDRLRAEAIAVAGTGPVEHSHLDRLVLNKQVLKESMRLYPPAPIMNRITTEEISFGGQTLPAGTTVVLPIYAIHRHRKVWTDPDAFEPARFAPESEKTYARTQFMPFGFGPRLCIGMSFAMMEAQALLATLVRGARFTCADDLLPEPVSRVTLRPRHGMPLAVTVL